MTVLDARPAAEPHLTVDAPAPGPVVVPARDLAPGPGPWTGAALAALSCRLHGAIDRAAGTAEALELDLPPAADADPALLRVLTCARASARARGLDLRAA